MATVVTVEFVAEDHEEYDDLIDGIMDLGGNIIKEEGI